MSVTRKSRFLDRSTPPHIATLIMMAGLSAIPMNMFLPSLPNMAQHFNTDYAVIQLSLTLYLAVNAITQVLIGPIADQYGRRPSFWSDFSCSFWQRSAPFWPQTSTRFLSFE